MEGGNPAEIQVKRLDRRVDFPSRSASEPDCFIAEGVALRPAECGLGNAGRQPTRAGMRASGVWRGSITGGGDAAAAASRIAPLLAGTVFLDGCGTLAEPDLVGSSLHFRKAAQWEEQDDTADRVAQILGGPATFFILRAQLGQILTHSVYLWLRPSGSEIDALLHLQPLQRPSKPGVNFFEIARPSPMGCVSQRWEEVALIELPRLLKLTMHESADRRAAAMVRAEPKFLVDEEEEIIKIQCWQRTSGDESPAAASREALSLEQLLWYTTVAALSETSPCAEAAVPMQRIELSDEGTATREELLGDVAEHDVPKEDAPRLASLVFLRQFVKHEVIAEEVLPRLLPSSGLVRVLSGQLASRAAGSPEKGRASQSRPKTLDDLFSDDLDFRAPVPWATRSKEEDPLANHELTSIFLLNESRGFAMSFHCLQGIDPLDS